MNLWKRKLLAAAAALELARHGAPLHIWQLARLVVDRHRGIAGGSSERQVAFELTRNLDGVLERVEPGVYRCKQGYGVGQLSQRLQRLLVLTWEEALKSEAERDEGETRTGGDFSPEAEYSPKFTETDDEVERQAHGRYLSIDAARKRVDIDYDGADYDGDKLMNYDDDGPPHHGGDEPE